MTTIPPPGTPVTPSRVSARVILLLCTLVLVNAVAIGLIVWSRLPRGLSDLDPGSCVHQSAVDEVVPADCDTPEADYTVVGVVHELTQTEADDTGACDRFPSATTSFWAPEKHLWGTTSAKGFVLCLADHE